MSILLCLLTKFETFQSYEEHHNWVHNILYLLLIGRLYFESNALAWLLIDETFIPLNDFIVGHMRPDFDL